MKPTVRLAETDPRDRPAYPAAEAAALIGVSSSTLQKWIKGRTYPTKQGTRTSAAILQLPEPGYLSFTNLVEAHVLAGLRRHTRLSLESIRRAVRYVEREFKDPHALVRKDFKTDGVNCFLDRVEGLLNASLQGQYAMRELIEQHLRDVEYDRQRAARLFLRHREDAPRLIVVDPRRAFGRPVLDGTSVPIAVISSRFTHGDTIEDLARDYETSVDAITEVIRATITKAA